MATPIPPRELGILLASGVTLPLAAFLAALDFDSGKKRAINIFGLILGLVAIVIVSSVMYINR